MANTIDLTGKITLKNNTTNKTNIVEQIAYSLTGVKEWDSRKITIAPNTLDESISLAGVSNLSFLYIHATSPITVKLNGATTASSKGTVFLFTGQTGGFITQLEISNAEVVESEITLILGGVE